MPTLKTYGPLHLSPTAPPLPSLAAVPAIGLGLCENLRRAAARNRALKLVRWRSGVFSIHSDERQNGWTDRGHDPVGDLAAVLSRPTAAPLSDASRQLVGIPTAAQEPLIGELLIRLFTAAQIHDIWIAFEYLPWIEEHLCYRLRLRVRYDDAATADRDFFIHGRSAEAALIAGLHFFAASPQAYP